MKVPPALNLNTEINRVGMASALPFGPELLWPYGPLSTLQQHQPQQSIATPSSPLLDMKNQMPNHLAVDPRLWSREDVSSFLRWFEREFELPKIDIAKFCMNGKALCMLNKADLADRAPGAGDVLHNTLQFLLRDTPQVPPSPITPHLPLLSPSPLTQTQSQPWPLVGSADFHNLGHLLQQGGSVTLSPAPSDQSGGSPRHPDSNSASGVTSYHLSSSGSTHSDSEESTRDSNSPQRSPIPPHSVASSLSAHALASLKHFTDYQRAATAAAAAAAAAAVHNKEENKQQHSMPKQQPTPVPHPNSIIGDEPVETGTNGRLLWDFLQQLLNDSQQRYSRFIAWKNRDTGVFKIVDPPGLARLWGIQKNHLSMNYDKMSRALRYYYRVNILRKVQGERHCYQFLRNPSELKSIKNISLLRGAPAPQSPRARDPPPPAITQMPSMAPTPMEEDEKPTDLSMGAPHHKQTQPQRFTNGPTRSDEPSLPQNLSIERQDVKSEVFSQETYE